MRKLMGQMEMAMEQRNVTLLPPEAMESSRRGDYCWPEGVIKRSAPPTQTQDLSRTSTDSDADLEKQVRKAPSPMGRDKFKSHYKSGSSSFFRQIFAGGGGGSSRRSK